MINSFCYSQKGLIYYDYIDAKGVGNAKGQASNSYMAFNKEMYPDASLEKYINEAPEITKNIKSLLVKQKLATGSTATGRNSATGELEVYWFTESPIQDTDGTWDRL